MKFSNRKIFTLSLIGAALFLLAGCATEIYPELRYETAKRLAMPSFMYERRIKTDTYLITAFERVYNPGGNATVYIDGDGPGWSGTETDSHDPTPLNPVALHIATRDNSKNVIYLARPCHFTALADGTRCSVDGWKDNRFSPETVDAMNAALNNIKRKYNIAEFNLVGYDGGASMAALIAAERNDIKSIRTVAGKLDYDQIITMKEANMDKYDASSVAQDIAYIPQQHFIGEWDDEVTPAQFDAYKAASGDSPCVKASIVTEATHDKGWVNRWPELRQAPLNCRAE